MKKKPAAAGYSGTPLAQKLGYKAGLICYLRSAPENYRELIDPLPDGVCFRTRLQAPLDFVHFFVSKKAELETELPKLKAALAPDGALWVSWPKKAAKVETDITEDVIRDIALSLGLVDIKVCAVDDTWSGLKLVIRKELRAPIKKAKSPRRPPRA